VLIHPKRKYGASEKNGCKELPKGKSPVIEDQADGRGVSRQSGDGSCGKLRAIYELTDSGDKGGKAYEETTKGRSDDPKKNKETKGG